ncbi:MAG: glycosyltransferase [Duncaniella sp.]|nr:glycosyltransferase [Duncaniella sp.]
MPNPILTVITVCYNAEATIERTLKSLDEQSFRLFEHLIIDGASKDSTLNIIAEHTSPNRRIVSEPDKGLYDAMNKGLALAKGDYVVFLNSGDRFHSPDTLLHVSDAMLENDYPGIVYGQTDLVDNEGRKLGPRHLTAPEILTTDSFKDGMLICHQAFFVLRKITGKYDLKYSFSADYDWCIRCIDNSRRNFYLNEVLVDFLSEGMTSRNRRASLIERYKIMCRRYGTISTTLRHLKFACRWWFKRSA